MSADCGTRKPIRFFILRAVRENVDGRAEQLEGEVIEKMVLVGSESFLITAVTSEWLRMEVCCSQIAIVKFTFRNQSERQVTSAFCLDRHTTPRIDTIASWMVYLSPYPLLY